MGPDLMNVFSSPRYVSSSGSWRGRSRRGKNSVAITLYTICPFNLPMGWAFVITTMYLSSLTLVSHTVLDQLLFLPSRNLIIPRIPAILDTRLPPNNAPSFRRKSPLGRSTTSVGAVGDEGEVKA